MSQPGYPPPYAQQQYAPPAPARNGFGITTLVLAIIGCVFGLIPFTGFIALILGLLAVLFGLLGLGRVRRRIADNKILTIVGTVLGVLSTVLGIVGIVIVFNAVDQLGRDLESIGGPPPVVQPEGAQIPTLGEQPAAVETASVAAFGETVTFASGLSVSIAAPVDYRPSEFAAMGQSDERAMMLTVTVTNGGAAPVELNPFINGPQVSHGGVSAMQVFDYNNGLREVPATQILPGDTVVYDAAFGLAADTATVQAEFTDGVFGDPAIFTGDF